MGQKTLKSMYPTFSSSKFIVDAPHLIQWASICNLETNIHIKTELQDVYARTSVEDIKNFIIQIYSNNKTDGNLKSLLFSISKMMGQDTLYDVIKIIALHIANKMIDEMYNEKVSIVDKQISDLSIAEENFKAKEVKIDDEVKIIKSENETLKQKNVSLIRKNSDLCDEVGKLTSKCEEFKYTADKWLLLRTALDDLLNDS